MAEEETYYQRHKEDILRKSKERYHKNKNTIKDKNLIYYYDNKDKWKKYYHKRKKKNEAIDEKLFNEFKKEVITSGLKELEEENKQLDKQIKQLKIKIWRKNSYIKSREKLKEIKNKVTIEPDAKLVIYWND